MLLENVYEGLNARKCVSILKCSKMCMKAEMLVLGVFIQSVFLPNVPDLRVLKLCEFIYFHS